MFEKIAEMGHEQVILCHDPSVGYQRVIAIHSTVLGPAVGGTRFWPFEARHGEELKASGILYRAGLITVTAVGI